VISSPLHCDQVMSHSLTAPSICNIPRALTSVQTLFNRTRLIVESAMTQCDGNERLLSFTHVWTIRHPRIVFGQLLSAYRRSTACFHYGRTFDLVDTATRRLPWPTLPTSTDGNNIILEVFSTLSCVSYELESSSFSAQVLESYGNSKWRVPIWRLDRWVMMKESLHTICI
jgi:hypothetical protein